MRKLSLLIGFLSIASLALAQLPPNFESSLVPNTSYDALVYIAPEVVSLILQSPVSKTINLTFENLTIGISSLTAWLSPVKNSEVVGLSIEFINETTAQMAYEAIEAPDIWKRLDGNKIFILYGNFSEPLKERIISKDFVYLKDKIPEVYSLPSFYEKSISIGYLRITNNLMNFLEDFLEEGMKENIKYIKLLGIDYLVFNVYSKNLVSEKNLIGFLLVRSKYPKFFVDLSLWIAKHFTPMEKTPEGYRITVDNVYIYLKTKGFWFSRASIYAAVGDKEGASKLINSI